MIKYEIIIAGFGGQGILSMGKIIAYAGLLDGKEVSWFPSYGPEQRGGTANVTIILSEKLIFSPILNEYDIAILLNQPSLEKFEKTIKSNGILICNKNKITQSPKRQDIKVIKIDTLNSFFKKGNGKIFNMVMLGVLIQTTKIITIENAIKGLKETFPKLNNKSFQLNQKSILEGIKLAIAIK